MIIVCDYCCAVRTPKTDQKEWSLHTRGKYETLKSSQTETTRPRGFLGGQSISLCHPLTKLKQAFLSTLQQALLLHTHCAAKVSKTHDIYVKKKDTPHEGPKHGIIDTKNKGIILGEVNNSKNGSQRNGAEAFDVTAGLALQITLHSPPPLNITHKSVVC